MSAVTEKAISIRCHGSHSVDIDELIPLQGSLKQLTKENYEKLKKVVLDLGFSEPISAWFEDRTTQWHVLNGHQRLNVLRGMRAEGYFVPPIPISSVEAKDIQEAKKKVLTLTSQYGEITDEGLYEFLSDASVDWQWAKENLRLPEIDMSTFDASYFTEPGVLPEISGDPKEPFRAATFIVHDSQWEKIEEALSKAKSDGLDKSDVNQNSNGNALYHICLHYLDRVDGVS